jgi:hypothetical protein
MVVSVLQCGWQRLSRAHVLSSVSATLLAPVSEMGLGIVVDNDNDNIDNKITGDDNGVVVVRAMRDWPNSLGAKRTREKEPSEEETIKL